MRILYKTRLIHFMVIILSISMLNSADNLNQQMILKDIKLEISANSEINCGDTLKIEVKLINASNESFVFNSEWFLPSNNIKLHFLNEHTRKDLNLWYLDHYMEGVNFVKLYPDEYIGRIFLFKLDSGKMIFLNKRLSETQVKDPVLINLFDYEVKGNDFIIKAEFRLRARFESEKKIKSNSKDYYIYKELGYLESNEIVVKNLCKSEE